MSGILHPLIGRVIGAVGSGCLIVELLRFGPDDEASVATYVATESACLVDAPWWHPHTVHRQTMLMRHGWDGEVGRHFLLRADGQVVGRAAVHSSDYDNLDAAWVELSVHPDLRRRGYGAAGMQQAFDVVRWLAEHDDHGNGRRMTVGGQSAGGALAAAVARLSLEQGGPRLALQVLHYPPLDLATPAPDKKAAIAKPMLRPWMGEVFDSAYVPDVAARQHRLVSPASSADTADLTGIAPAVVITAEYDRLNAEGVRYAHRLDEAGALVAHHDVRGADHGYDVKDTGKARETYALIAGHVRDATA